MWNLGRIWKSQPPIPHWGPIETTGTPPPAKIQWNLTYCTPDGEEVPPRAKVLRSIIYGQGPVYYANSGSASLYGTARDSRGVLVYSVHNTPLLSWFLEEPFGFHFSFHPVKGPSQLTYDGTGPRPRVTHYLGGEPIYLPRGCFVSRDLAWEVVQEFLRTQQPSPAVKWIRSLELEALGIDHNRPD